MIYFDHNATSPLSPTAREAWISAAEKFIGNPSSPHRLGARAEAALGEARVRFSQILGCKAQDLIWTSGATESANAVISHLAHAAGEQEIWISASEHPCVLESARRSFGDGVKLIPIGATGHASEAWALEALERGQRPAAIVVMAANNETGILQDWGSWRRLCAEREIPYVCDATQWVGRMAVGELGSCDFVIGSAHKFGGPRGVGFIKCPGKIPLRGLLAGGGQEEGRRAGTENVPGVLGALAALEACEQQLRQVPPAQSARLRDEFEKALALSIPGVRVVGLSSPRLWNTSMVLMPRLDCRVRWVVKLDKRGFAVSTGSACASGREKPSHVLEAMGYTADESGGALRFSAGWETEAGEWERLLAAVEQEWRAMRGTDLK